MSTTKTASSPFHPRVIITGHNSSGQAIVQESYLSDERIFEDHAFTNHHLYSTSSMPVDLNDDVDISNHKSWLAQDKVGITIKNGTVCRFVNLAPGHQPLSHRTQSLDFGIVVDGSVIMDLDDGSETTLEKGDIVVQRGTTHAWKNPSNTDWARMVFFLQDCRPIKGFKEDLGHKDGLGNLFSATYANGNSSDE